MCRHKVTGWTLKKETKTNEIALVITFKRLASEPSMDSVLCRPWSDEVEDYVEYKRIRKQFHDSQNDAMRLKPTASAISTDGACDGAVLWPVEKRRDSAADL